MTAITIRIEDNGGVHQVDARTDRTDRCAATENGVSGISIPSGDTDIRATWLAHVAIDTVPNLAVSLEGEAVMVEFGCLDANCASADQPGLTPRYNKNPSYIWDYSMKSPTSN